MNFTCLVKFVISYLIFSLPLNGFTIWNLMLSSNLQKNIFCFMFVHSPNITFTEGSLSAALMMLQFWPKLKFMTNLQVDLLSPVLWVENKAGPGLARCWPALVNCRHWIFQFLCQTWRRARAEGSWILFQFYDCKWQMNDPVVQQSAEECSECGALQALQTLPHKDDTEEFPRIIADNWLWLCCVGGTLLARSGSMSWGDTSHLILACTQSSHFYHQQYDAD